MFADPTVITVDAVPKSLNRVVTSATGAKYLTSDRAHRLEVDHQDGKRLRHRIKFAFDSLSANPLISGQNVTQSMSCSLLVDVPVGYDTATAKKQIDGLLAALSASSGAMVTKLLGGES